MFFKITVLFSAELQNFFPFPFLLQFSSISKLQRKIFSQQKDRSLKANEEMWDQRTAKTPKQTLPFHVMLRTCDTIEGAILISIVVKCMNDVCRIVW